MNTEDSGFEQSSMEDSPKSSVKEIGFEQSSIEDLSKSSVKQMVEVKKKTRTPTCSFCRNHNIKTLYSLGHKSICLGQYCKCEACCKVRARQKKSASETRDSRAKQNLINRKKLKEEYNIPEQIPLNLKEKITPFEIDYSLKSQFSKKKEEERRIAEEATSFLSFKKRKSKRSSNEPRTNEQKKDVDEIIIILKDFEELLQYTLHCTLDCFLTRYDIHVIKSLMNEVVAIILKYASAKITLDYAKFCISKLIIETNKLNESCCSISSSNTVGAPFIHEWTYMTHSYFNGLVPQHLYPWPFLTNVPGSLPRLDNLPTSSTEPSTESSICYRPISNGQ